MRMRVDGSSSLVLPMYEVDGFYSHNYSSDDQRDIRKIRAYWESAVSLEDFARDFVNPHKREYIWYSKDGTRRIEKPEVLIPGWNLGKVSFLNAPKN